MSKSLEFIKQRASNKSYSTFYDRDFSKAKEMDTLSIFRAITGSEWGKNRYHIECDAKSDDGDVGHRVIDIIIDPDGDFDYFTSESCLCDGTYYFYIETIRKALLKIITGQTYNSNYTKPKITDAISYTVGNVIVLDEYDYKFAPQDRPWLTSRVTIMIPLKYKIDRKEQ